MLQHDTAERCHAATFPASASFEHQIRSRQLSRDEACVVARSRCLTMNQKGGETNEQNKETYRDQRSGLNATRGTHTGFQRVGRNTNHRCTYCTRTLK